MGKHIKIFDTTLRDGEQTPGVNLNVYEKVEIAKQLERLGVDILEAGFAISSQGDFDAIKAVAENVKDVGVASLSRALEKDIDRSWDAIKDAKRPCIHTFLATSDIHLKHKLRLTEDQAYEQAVAMVKYARNLCPEVEFSAEDASRSRPEFLYKVFEGVIKAGATIINVPDTVGYSTPEEFGLLIKNIKDNVEGADRVTISVHCHNDLGLAVANSLAAVRNGATQVESTINGLGERAGNAAMEEVIMALNTRRDFYGYTNNIDTTQFHRASRLVTSLTGVVVQPNKAIVGANAFAHESGIHQHGILSEKTTYEIMSPESIGLKKNTMVLGKHSGKHAFEDKLKEMGYTLSEEQIKNTFIKFKDLADRKKEVLDSDIEAIVEEKVAKIPEIFVLESYQISSGNRIVPTSTVNVRRNGNVITEAATGEGPVDAAFNALDRAVGISMKLEEYRLRAVTGGKDALGEVSVRVEKDGRMFSGRGVSTDVIEASVRAYLSAVNRVLSELGEDVFSRR